MNMAVNVTIAPILGEEPKIVIGFHSDAFSQAIFVPYTSLDDAKTLQDTFAAGIDHAVSEITKSRLSTN